MLVLYLCNILNEFFPRRSFFLGFYRLFPSFFFLFSSSCPLRYSPSPTIFRLREWTGISWRGHQRLWVPAQYPLLAPFFLSLSLLRGKKTRVGRRIALREARIIFPCVMLTLCVKLRSRQKQQKWLTVFVLWSHGLWLVHAFYKTSSRIPHPCTP
jgi:hypothetical protein